MAGRVVAIDLGSYSVKVAFATAGWGHSNVVDFVERAVPGGDRGDSLRRSAAIVQEILRERADESDTVYIAVPGNLISSRVLEFGFRHLKRADLEKAVGAELEGVLPYDLDEMVYTFDSLPRDLGAKPEPELRAPQNEITDDEPTFVGGGADVDASPPPGVVAAPTTGMRVFACAMLQDKARELLEITTYAGEEPRGLIVGATGFSRIVERVEGLSAAAAHDPVAVIDMGHQRTDVCVVKSGRVIFSRTVERGGRDVTEAIARAWNIPYEEAEKAKHSDGFIASQAEPAPSDAWRRIHDVVSQELDPLARELRRTLKACRAETGGTVAATVIVGGASRLRGVASFLAEQLALPVSVLGPADAERLVGGELASRGVPADVATCATGVALDGAAGGVMYDLRQGPLAFRADFSFLRQKIAHIAAVALIIIAFAAGNAYAALYKLRADEGVLTERIAVESLQATGKRMTYDEIITMVGPQQAVEESPLPKMTAWDILLEINAKLPPRSEVTIDVKNVDIRPGQISITATALDTKQVGAVEKALKSIECFDDVSKPNISSGANDVKSFTISIKSSCM
jgi:general secretion pathway protein L